MAESVTKASGAPAAGRWAPGSWPRLVHAALLCVLQPSAPAATLALFHGFILRPDGELAPDVPLWVAPAMALCGAAAVALVVGGGLLAVAKLRPASIGWTRERPRRALGLGLAGAALATLAVLGAAAVFGANPMDGLRQMLGYTTSQRLAFAAIALTISALEESLFRGYLQGELARRIGLGGAVAITAVAYAAYHFPLGHPDAMLARLGQGLVYGALRGRDRSLATPALAHFLCWTFVGLY